MNVNVLIIFVLSLLQVKLFVFKIICHLSQFCLKIPMQTVQLYQPFILQLMIAVNQ